MREVNEGGYVLSWDSFITSITKHWSSLNFTFCLEPHYHLGTWGSRALPSGEELLKLNFSTTCGAFKKLVSLSELVIIWG